VEGVGEGDDLVRAAAVQLAELACQLDRAFVGLGAAAGEVTTVQATELRQPAASSTARSL
jgi:hypothetical protein